MNRRVIWLPGDFPSTNKLLDLARASGFYHGAAQAGGTPAGKRRPISSFNGEISRIRTWTFARARRGTVRAHCPPLSKLRFLLLGSGRYDPSAWYLSAKAVEDGLVDAHVLASDRRDVLETAGRCATSEDEARAMAEAFGVPRRARERGMIVLLEAVEGVSDAAL